MDQQHNSSSRSSTQIGDVIDLVLEQTPIPVKHARVCRHWQQAAVAATPYLKVKLNSDRTAESLLLYLRNHAQHVRGVGIFSDARGDCSNSKQTRLDVSQLGASRLELKVLRLFDPSLELSSTWPSHLSSLQTLELTCCSMPRVADALTQLLVRLTDLRSLTVDSLTDQSKAQTGDAAPGQLADFTAPATSLAGLQKLTKLDLCGDVSASHFQCVSTLTALHELRLACTPARALQLEQQWHLPASVSQLRLDGIAGSSVLPVGPYTALRSLTLWWCGLQPQRLLSQTAPQLQHLRLHSVHFPAAQDQLAGLGDADAWQAEQEAARAALKAGVSGLLAEVAQLQQLTSLYLLIEGRLEVHRADMQHYNPAAYSALTASPVLQQLQLLMPWWQPAAWSHALPPSRQLTALTYLTLHVTGAAGTLLQQVVTSCPALQDVELLCMSAAALQLPALQRLQGLTRVALSGCNNAVAKQLAACTQLQELCVANNLISQPSVDAVPVPAALNHHGLLHLTALQHLNYLWACVVEDGQVSRPKFHLKLQSIVDPKPVLRQLLERCQGCTCCQQEAQPQAAAAAGEEAASSDSQPAAGRCTVWD